MNKEPVLVPSPKHALSVNLNFIIYIVPTFDVYALVVTTIIQIIFKFGKKVICFCYSFVCQNYFDLYKMYLSLTVAFCDHREYS